MWEHPSVSLASVAADVLVIAHVTVNILVVDDVTVNILVIADVTADIRRSVRLRNHARMCAPRRERTNR